MIKQIYEALNFLIHNLNNKTMAISGFVELSLDLNDLSDKTKERLTKVLSSIDDVQKIINEMSTLLKEEEKNEC